MDGKLFYAIRVEAGLSPEEFAKELGVKTAKNWELGHTAPSQKSMRKLKEFCMNHLIDFEELNHAWESRTANKLIMDNPLVRIRLAAGFSQKEFADCIGVNTVANWERGKSLPNYASMKKIVKFCKENGIDYSELQTIWTTQNRFYSTKKSLAQQKRREAERKVIKTQMAGEVRKLEKDRRFRRAFEKRARRRYDRIHYAARGKTIG